jgi:hypothetical protein
LSPTNYDWTELSENLSECGKRLSSSDYLDFWDGIFGKIEILKSFLNLFPSKTLSSFL